MNFHVHMHCVHVQCVRDTSIIYKYYDTGILERDHRDGPAGYKKHKVIIMYNVQCTYVHVMMCIVIRDDITFALTSLATSAVICFSPAAGIKMSHSAVNRFSSVTSAPGNPKIEPVFYKSIKHTLHIHMYMSIIN